MEQREKNERKINLIVNFFRRMRMSQFAWRHWKYKSDTSSNNTNGKHFIINYLIPPSLNCIFKEGLEISQKKVILKLC